MELKSSAGAATIGVSGESQVFTVGEGVWHVYIGGDASTSTLTLQVSDKQDTGFDTYYADDSADTPTAQAFTVVHVPSTSAKFHRFYVDHGMYFKFVADASGTPAWEIDVHGRHLRIIEES